jgi:hypothetical protein
VTNAYRSGKPALPGPRWDLQPIYSSPKAGEKTSERLMARGLTCKEEMITGSAMRLDVAADSHEARDLASTHRWASLVSTFFVICSAGMLRREGRNAGAL